MAKRIVTRSKLVKNLDTVFSKYIRLKNVDKYGMCKCVTCNKKVYWKQIQAGHFMSRKHYSTRWDEENVYPQCLACNVFRGGEQYRYSLFLGKDKSEKMYQLSKRIIKFNNSELDYLITKYKKLVTVLEKKYI
tara:strand:- start:5409 stop:5807 length:399 start_codon:yes stop_codon:yes gene_type:complete